MFNTYVKFRGNNLKFIVVSLFGISIVVVIWIIFSNPTYIFAAILCNITGFFKCFTINFTITHIFVINDIIIFGYCQISFIVSSSQVTPGITNLLNTPISFILKYAEYNYKWSISIFEIHFKKKYSFYWTVPSNLL